MIGRFGALDPVESALNAPFDGGYVYVNGRPTVLTDPSGLDPWIQGARLDCARNAYLCRLIYAAGYRDHGCGGQCKLRALTLLAGRGITVDKLAAVAHGKAQIINAPEGRDGPGIYFFADGKATLIRPDKDAACGVACSLGLAATKILGCNSEASCAIQAATLFTPGAGACRVAGRAAKGLKALGPGTTFGAKVEAQLAKRGWTKELVESTIAKPSRTVRTRDTRHLPGGGRLDDPATAYYNPKGGYVVRNDRTGDIVQVSDRNKPTWRAPWD